MMKRVILLNPGPVNTSQRVQEALLRGDLCHRETEFSELMGGIRDKITRVFNTQSDYTTALVTGSGTAALEMGVASCLSPDKALLVINNGVYGERIASMAEAHDLDTVVLEYPWGEPPRLDDIEAALEKNPDIEVVAMVHHETTTGLLNPVRKVGELAHRFDRKFLVDGISSLAGEELDLAQCKIDYCIGTANKCVQGLPGVSFVLFGNNELPRLESLPSRSVYLDLYQNYRAQEKGDTLFTPGVQVHYAFDAALDELLQETVAARIERYRKAAHLLRQGFREMGLRFLIPEENHSNTLTALNLPGEMDYDQLHDQLKAKGFIIYAGQGNFNNSIFRVANMGDIRLDEFQRFLDALKECCTTVEKQG